MLPITILISVPKRKRKKTPVSTSHCCIHQPYHPNKIVMQNFNHHNTHFYNHLSATFPFNSCLLLYTTAFPLPFQPYLCAHNTQHILTQLHHNTSLLPSSYISFTCCNTTAYFLPLPAQPLQNSSIAIASSHFYKPPSLPSNSATSAFKQFIINQLQPHLQHLPFKTLSNCPFTNLLLWP